MNMYESGKQRAKTTVPVHLPCVFCKGCQSRNFRSDSSIVSNGLR